MKNKLKIIGIAFLSIYIFLFVGLLIANMEISGSKIALYFTFSYYVLTGGVIGIIELIILGILFIKERNRGVFIVLIVAIAFSFGSFYFLFIHKGALLP